LSLIVNDEKMDGFLLKEEISV